MKKLLLLASLLAATMPALGQGWVNFSSLVPGAAYVTNYFECAGGPTCPRLAGPGYRAMLYIGPAGTIYPGALTTNGVQGASAPFLTGASAGRFDGGKRIISGYNPGDTITVQVRVWSANFTNWESAPLIRVKSNHIQVTLGASAASAGNLTGLQTMTLIGPYWAAPDCGSVISTSVLAGGTATLVTIPFPVPALPWPFCSEGLIDYKWSRNGTTLSFAPTLTITNAQAADAGTYDLRVESDQGWHDMSATLTVLMPPVRLNSPTYTNGGFQFTLTGPTGSNYVIQSSTDLAASNWVSRVTNTAPFTFVDTNLSLSPQLFYRAVTP